MRILLIDELEKAYFSIIWSSELNGISTFWMHLNSENEYSQIWITWGEKSIFSIEDSENEYESICLIFSGISKDLIFRIAKNKISKLSLWTSLFQINI